MNPDFAALTDYSMEQIAELLNHCFAGYVAPVRFDASSVAGMTRGEDIDLAVSRRALVQGRPAAIALIARRGWTCRLAAMAVAESRRRNGLGRALVRQIMDDARSRGDRHMTLEVVESNSPAIGLYESEGFAAIGRLVGFVREAAHETAGLDSGLEEEDVAAIGRMVAREAPDLPWQLAGETVAALGAPNLGFRLGAARAVISRPDSPHVAIRALVTPRESRRRGDARALLRGLAARYPGKTWRVTPVVPDDSCPGFFESAGFRLDSLAQLWMTCRL